ncbi:hypothetical protein U1Q18_026560 [Sarracenia purpurea var. burkii]
MKLICGITVAEGKGKVGKEGKYTSCARRSESLVSDSAIPFWRLFVSVGGERRRLKLRSSAHEILGDGGYDKEEKAARAYDLAALKYWGPTTTTNFPVSNYEKELEEMKNMTRQEFVASLRRYHYRSFKFSLVGWMARTQEEAAEAYDIAAIKFRGLNAVTNFDMSRYDVKSIANSNLPVGGLTAKPKTSSDSFSDTNNVDGGRSDDRDPSSASSVTFTSQPQISTVSCFALPIKQDFVDYWSILGYHHHNSSDLNNSKNPNENVLYQASSSTNGSSFQGTTAFSMDFNTSSSVSGGTTTTTSATVPNHHNGFFGGGVGNYLQQQSNSTPSGIPFAAPIALNGNSSYEGSAGFGNWVAPSLHSFQPAKPNLSVFQTPIFGME